jgi:hypothetical protein
MLYASGFWVEFLKLDLNEKGDTLAGVFGSLAFLAAAIAVFMQSRELNAQREELKQTRKQFELMNAKMSEQNSDSFFFELVATHNSVVESIDIRKPKTGEVLNQGRDCFRAFFKSLEMDQGERMYPDQAKDKTDARYLKMFTERSSDLGQYFRFVYNSMRAIEESTAGNLKHKRLFRALFSDDELLIIFYNCLSPRGEKLIYYAESFKFFDNLPKDRLIYQSHWSDYIRLLETQK